MMRVRWIALSLIVACLVSCETRRSEAPTPRGDWALALELSAERIGLLKLWYLPDVSASGQCVSVEVPTRHRMSPLGGPPYRGRPAMCAALSLGPLPAQILYASSEEDSVDGDYGLVVGSVAEWVDEVLVDFQDGTSPALLGEGQLFALYVPSPRMLRGVTLVGDGRRATCKEGFTRLSCQSFTDSP
jgi:hypothetical protein